MKNIIILVVMLLVSYTGFAQQTAFFETTLYFEDAVGNRDSVILGHDPEANGNFNPDFGEIDINTPWDSVLEIRATHGSTFYEFPDISDVFSKKIIGSTPVGIDAEYNCMPVKEYLLLYVSVKYLPLKITWNNLDFNNFCNSTSTITPHQTPLVAFTWWNSPRALAGSACMLDTNEFVVNTFYDEWINWWIMDQKEGVGLDTMHGVLVLFTNEIDFDTPCNRDLVSVSPTAEITELSIFPNPTSGLLHLESEARLNWKLFDTNGRLLREGIEPQLDTSIYPDGIYFLQVASIGGGPPTVRKVVKMEG